MDADQVNSHTCWETKQNQNPRRPSGPLSVTPSWQHERPPDFDFHKFLWPVSELCISGTQQYVPFCAQSLSCSILFAGFTFAIACSWSSLWLSAACSSNVWLFHSSPAHYWGACGAFSVRAYPEECFINTSTCLLLNTYNYFSWVSLRSGIAGHGDMHVQH